MIEKYMSNSPLRAKMDAGDEAAIYSGDKQLIRSVDFSDCLPKGDRIVPKEPLRFLSEFYNRLQWETCRSSKSIVEVAPPQEVLRQFYQKDGDAAKLEIAIDHFRKVLYSGNSVDRNASRPVGSGSEIERAGYRPDLFGSFFIMDETSAPYEQWECPFSETLLDKEFEKMIIEKYHLVTKEMEEGSTE